MSTETVKSEGLYYSIIDGTFRRRVPEGTQGAVRREYETKDGAKAEKYEIKVEALAGHIEDIGIYDGDYGRQLKIKLDKNADGVHPEIQLNVETTYGEDVLKKLPHVDFHKEVKFRPFAFTDDNGREVRGVEVSQGETKYKNFFWDYEKKEAVNGLPVPQGDTDSYSKDDWKIHFLSVRKFLIAYFTDTVRPRFEKEHSEERVGSASPLERPETPDESWREDDEEIKPEDIPF